MRHTTHLTMTTYQICLTSPAMLSDCGFVSSSQLCLCSLHQRQHRLHMRLHRYPHLHLLAGLLSPPVYLQTSALTTIYQSEIALIPSKTTAKGTLPTHFSTPTLPHRPLDLPMGLQIGALTATMVRARRKHPLRSRQSRPLVEHLQAHSPTMPTESMLSMMGTNDHRPSHVSNSTSPHATLLHR